MTRAERNERIREAAKLGMPARSIARKFGLSETYVRRLADGYQHNSDSYRAYRLPKMLEAARSKVRALENEARRRGMNDLIGGGA